MALTRRSLKNMGIDDEKIEEIIASHTETVDALKEQRDSYKADAEKLPAVQKELDDLKAAVKDDGYEGKYNDLKGEFEAYKKGVEEKETTAKKEKAYRTILKDCGVSEKRIDSVMKVTDFGKLKLDKDGNLEGVDALKNDIKEEWSEFIVTEGAKGADVPKPPESSGKTTYKDKSEIMAIKDVVERQKAIADNIEMFRKGD